MRSRILFFTAALMIAASFSSHASFQDPVSTPEKPLYRPSGNEATLVGTIRVNGEIPTRKKIDMYADPVCVNFKKSPRTDSLVANHQLLQNAFVYVKEGDPLKEYRFQQPESEAVLEHKGCYFSPHILGVRVGQRLSIVNSDPTQHNTHPTPKSNPEWNQSQPAQGDPIIKTFSRPEVMIPFKCNQHPWEKAYVGILDHPFFAVSNKFGNYEIRGLPPGTYTLSVWHEVLGEQEVEIKVTAGETRSVDFILDAIKTTASRAN